VENGMGTRNLFTAIIVSDIIKTTAPAAIYPEKSFIIKADRVIALITARYIITGKRKPLSISLRKYPATRE